MAKISIGKNTYMCPGSFDELTQAQLIYFCKLLCADISKEEILRRIAYRFIGAPIYIYYNASLIQRLQIEQSFDWIFTDVITRNNKLPSFSHNGFIYYGYSNNLENVLVKEWMVGDAALRKYKDSKADADRVKFIAAYYRPMRKDGIEYGDQRQPFDEAQCEHTEKALSSLPGYLKLAITINYAGMRSQTVKDFPHVFKNSGSSGPDFGIPGMVHDLSGPELGTVKDIEDKWFIRNLFWIAEKNEIRRLEKKANNNA